MGRLVTVEIRWFFTGPITGEVQDWFVNRLLGSNLFQEKPRSDIYFPVQERDDLGLKLSRGRLELKWRREAQPFSLSLPPISGVKESWVKEKWRYVKKNADAIVKGFTKPRLKGGRVEILKQRAVREYRPEASGEISEITQVLDFDAMIDEKSEPVIKIELTSLNKHGQPGWTLGVEAAGEPEKLHEIFDRAVEVLLKDYPLANLKSAYSYGYPWWVAQKNG